ncbi:Uncharacterised protein [Escherichia coli]|nr:Uncharacterised protein [Escherichia coli]
MVQNVLGRAQSETLGRSCGLVFNECHRRPGGNPQTQKSPRRGLKELFYWQLML